MAKRFSRRKSMKNNSFRRKSMKRKTMRRKTMKRRKTIKKKGGRPINMINRKLSLKNCESYFSTSNLNPDYNFSKYDHIDNITYDESKVKTFYELKINVNSEYYTATKSYSELVSDCDKLFSDYPSLSEEMKRRLEKNFSKIMNNEKCLKRVKAIEDAMKYLEMNIWRIHSGFDEIDAKLKSHRWVEKT